MKAKYKIIAAIIVIIILIFILFIKYEQELVFIKHLPITMKMAVKYDFHTDTWRKIKLEKFGLSRTYSLSSAEIEEFKSYLNSIEKVDVKIPEKQAFQYRIKVEKVSVDEINIEYWELYKIDGDNYIKDPQNNIIKIKFDMLQFLNDIYDN